MHTKASTEHLPGMTTSSIKLSINGPSIKSSSINESPSINTTPTPMDYSSIPRNPSNNTFSPLTILESERNEPIHNSDNISLPSMLPPKHLIPQPSFVKGHVEPMVITSTNSKPINSCPSTNSKNNPDKSALPDLAQSCSQVKHAYSMQNNKPIPSSNILTPVNLISSQFTKPDIHSLLQIFQGVTKKSSNDDITSLPNSPNEHSSNSSKQEEQNIALIPPTSITLNNEQQSTSSYPAFEPLGSLCHISSFIISTPSLMDRGGAAKPSSLLHPGLRGVGGDGNTPKSKFSSPTSYGSYESSYGELHQPCMVE